MTSQSRRVFIGSAAVVGLGSIGTTLLPSSEGHTHAAQRGADDPVSIELRKQMRTAVKGFGRRPGEHSRQLAATLRLYAAHGTAKGIDTALQRALREAIRQHGRDAVLLYEVPDARLLAEARDLGLAAPPPRSGLDYAGRKQALDDVLRNGATRRLRAAADALDALGDDLDRTGVQAAAFRLPGTTCTDMAQITRGLEYLMSFTCNPISLSTGIGTDLCVASFGAWAGAVTAYVLICGGLP